MAYVVVGAHNARVLAGSLTTFSLALRCVRRSTLFVDRRRVEFRERCARALDLRGGKTLNLKRFKKTPWGVRSSFDGIGVAGSLRANEAHCDGNLFQDFFHSEFNADQALSALIERRPLPLARLPSALYVRVANEKLAVLTCRVLEFLFNVCSARTRIP
jgi:hypothetical protein